MKMEVERCDEKGSFTFWMEQVHDSMVQLWMDPVLEERPGCMTTSDGLRLLRGQQEGLFGK